MDPRVHFLRARSLLAVAVTAGVVAVVPPGSATAKPKPPPAGAKPAGKAKPGQTGGLRDRATAQSKAKAPRATAAPQGPSCDLRADADRSAHDEWLSCISVDASLDSAPEVGEEATLTVEVQGDRRLTADIDITLPPNLEWVEAPAGLKADDEHSREPETRGQVETAEGKTDLQAGETTRFQGRVRAVSAGPAQIDVRATSDIPGGVEAGADEVFLTVQKESAKTDSSARIDPPDVGDVVEVDPGPAVRSTDAEPQAVPEEGLEEPDAPAARAACDTRVAGSWGYNDEVGAWHNQMNFQVQVWNKNTFFGDSLLASGLTNSSGGYNLCFDAFSEGWPDGGTADVYVKFVAENALWRVQNGGSPLSFATGVTWDITPGSTLNLGTLTTGDPTMHRGLHAFDEANDVWLWIPKPTNSCFDQKDPVCRQLKINWGPSSTDGTYYAPWSKDVHLAANDPNSRITVAHEIGHAIMDDVYNDAFPSAPNCNPHSIQGVSSTGCAWTEGWAEWFPLTVYNDTSYRWPSGASLNLENPTWGTAGWGTGDSTEGRVAGALLDLSDGTNDAPWDQQGEGPSPVWYTFTHHVSNTISAFWSHRAADGFAVGDTQLACLFQNTIDYGLREGLANYGELTRPTPSPAHNFRFNTSGPYWSVTAVRPPAGADFDLDLYDDRNQTLNLGSSAYGGATVDFVAIDSNRRALGDYYPRVRQWSGVGSYQIENAQGTNSIGYGTSPIAMGFNDVVVVRDVYLSAGVTETLRATATNGGQDAELFVLASDASASSWVRPRSSASAAASVTGPGGTETNVYTAPTSGWYGLVLINKSGSGTYNVSRSIGV